MSGESPAATPTHVTTFDYLGLGLILAPPPIVYEMWIRHEAVDWCRASIGYVIAVVVGVVMIWLSKRKTGKILGSLTWLRKVEGHIWARAIIVIAIVAGTLGIQSALLSAIPPVANHHTDEEFSALKTQLDVALNTQKATSSATSPANEPSEKNPISEIVGGPYRDSDIEDMRKALNDISKILVQRVPSIGDKAKTLLQGGDGLPQPPKQFSESLKAIIVELTVAQQDIHRSIVDADNFKDEIDPVVSKADQVLSHEIGILSRLSSRSDGAAKLNLTNGADFFCVEDSYNAASTEAMLFPLHVKSSNDDIGQKLQALRAYKR